MKRKKRKNKSILLRIMILGVCVYMLATLSGLLSDLNEKNLELSELKAQQTSVQNDIDEYRSLLEKGSEAEIIEKAARERLGYGYPDEQLFIDISGN